MSYTLVMKSQRLTYNVVYQAEPEVGYTATVPSLPGCITYGRTIDEAMTMVKDAITGYLASMRKHGETIPSDERTLAGTIDVLDRTKSRAKRLAYA